MSNKLRKYLPVLVLFITVSSINQWSDLPIGNTYIWWAIYSCILFGLYKSKKIYFDPDNKSTVKVIYWFLSWNIICIVRGIFVADNYWEWKNLVATGMVLLLPLTINISTHPYMIQRIVSTWLKYALPAFFVFLPFLQGDGIGRYLVPVSFLLLFFPSINFKWKAILLLFSLFVLLGDLSARSNIIKFTIPLMLSLLLYSKFLTKAKTLEIVRVSLIISPLLFFILAITGRFNVFQMDEYISGEFTTIVNTKEESREENLIADTRSAIYVEVINSALKHGYAIAGRTPARGNESELFGYYAFDELKTGKKERFSNEVSILNIFTWTGAIGVFLYFLIFYRASYLAINKSNNNFIRIIGLYVAFRWVYAWVEDFSQFDLSYLFLWMMIGMCFSKSFREMSDIDFRHWLGGVFDGRKRKIVVNPQLQASN
ncbi:hypothetical protein VF13_40815 [Nostoc linckia z16]|nr:hypothetical protein VF13_40815 [Nostoc linckia z16]